MNRRSPTETPSCNESQRTNSPALIVGDLRSPLARALVTDLLSQGAPISLLADADEDELAWIQPGPGVTVRRVGASPERDQQSYRDAVAEASRIFNLGWFSDSMSEDHPFENLGGLQHQLKLLEACAESAAVPRVVFASSALLYDASSGAEPVDEGHPLAPQTMNEVHTVAAENYHRVFGLLGAVTFSICRISRVYGSDVPASWNGWDLTEAIRLSVDGRGVPAPADETEFSDWIHIGDLIRALQIASVHPAARNQVFNVGSGEPISLRRAAEVVCECASGTLVRLDTRSGGPPNAEGRYRAVSTDKARSLLGFTTRMSFADGIAAMARDLEACASTPTQPRSVSAK